METKRPINVQDLRGVEIFAGLSDEYLALVARLCVPITYKAGEYCVEQGKTTDYLFIVNGGRVSVEIHIDVPRHSHTLTIATLTRGRACAWSALLPPNLLTASIKCLENTEMIAIKGTELQKLFEGRADLEAATMKNLARVVNSRLIDSRAQLMRLSAEILKEGARQNAAK